MWSKPWLEAQPTMYNLDPDLNCIFNAIIFEHLKGIKRIKKQQLDKKYGQHIFINGNRTSRARRN